jgi:hypothetical protein
MFLRNVIWHSINYAVLYLRRQNSSSLYFGSMKFFRSRIIFPRNLKRCFWRLQATQMWTSVYERPFRSLFQMRWISVLRLSLPSLYWDHHSPAQVMWNIFRAWKVKLSPTIYISVCSLTPPTALHFYVAPSAIWLQSAQNHAPKQ